ncbi:MAG: LPS export ABC transporter ATP-binding protein [Albidovulum sp.]|nr:LPS export ABC transporter ATP-binding protein [Albidovulum sp.]MDE0532534.1 LPS export ABC transporter ATP-binding protein [Albidovulum sp.]
MPDLGITATSLAKSFRRKRAVQGVEIRLSRHEVVGLLGPNGAGKTTCFYLIAGLLSPDSGKIFMDGRDVTHLPMYRRARLGLGYLPQESSVFLNMSVENNIMAILEFSVRNESERRRRLDELLSEFSIDKIRRSQGGTLSGGERRRVEIARCLASSPRYILLDEPFAGIDPISVDDMRQLVKHLKDSGVGILITDHNERATLNIVDRAYVMHDGKILAEGTPDEIISNDDVKRLYLGTEYES